MNSDEKLVTEEEGLNSKLFFFCMIARAWNPDTHKSEEIPWFKQNSIACVHSHETGGCMAEESS
jgi:hypothetical protein